MDAYFLDTPYHRDFNKYLGFKPDKERSDQSNNLQDSEESDEGEIIWKKETERLNFQWIEQKAPLMIMLVNDLNELAFKNKLFDHDIDQKAKQEIDDLYEQSRDIIARVDEQK